MSENSQSGKIRRGRQQSAIKKRAKEELGTTGFEEVLKGVENERPGQIQKNIQKFLEHKPDDKKNPWDTEGKGLAPGGELLTLEDLIYLKPFTMEEMNSTIAFRTNDKVMRAFQRLKEASGGVYDIMSDLYRDAAMIGLLVLSERHKSILGLDIVISQAEKHKWQEREAADKVLRLRDALKPLKEELRRAHFTRFMDYLAERPRWNQEIVLNEMRNDVMLAELLKTMEED